MVELTRNERNDDDKETESLLGGGQGGMGILADSPADCEKADRMGFIRKVLGILSVQLTFTFGCIAIVVTNKEMSD